MCPEKLDHYTLLMYHFYTARDSMNQFNKSDNGIHESNLKYILGISKDQLTFIRARLTHDANLIAFINSVRNLYDIFALLLNILLLESRIDESKCDIYKLLENLHESCLKNNLKELIGSYWFKYVVAFSNISKHRMLVTQQYSLDLIENKSGVKIGAFSYRGKDYPSYWSMEILESVLDVKNSIVKCGSNLNLLYAKKYA